MKYLADILVVGGLAVIGWGLWTAYQPAGIVFGGLALVAFGTIAAKLEKKGGAS